MKRNEFVIISTGTSDIVISWKLSSSIKYVGIRSSINYLYKLIRRVKLGFVVNDIICVLGLLFPRSQIQGDEDCLQWLHEQERENETEQKSKQPLESNVGSKLSAVENDQYTGRARQEEAEDVS